MTNDQKTIGIIQTILDSQTKPIKSHNLIKLVNQYGKPYGIEPIRSGGKLRDFIAQMRVYSICPVLACQDGYFKSTDNELIKTEVESLRRRAVSILMAANGLKRMVQNEPEKSQKGKMFITDLILSLT